ncbi:MAG: OmpH family outer membrane protein [Bacteroidetes bacterium]|nr:OmpH family outer membrane protein [Bacteroidota bacterium]
MKSIFKSLILTGLITSSVASFAQKAAFIDLDSLLSVMPEMVDAKKVSADHYKQLETTLTTMQKELNDKLADYQANEKVYTDLIKTTKQKELQDLNQRIQDFQVQAQTDFQKKNEELTKPINEKAKKAIEKVAKLKGYKVVLDSSLGVILYSEPVDDIFNAVKAELGVK